MKPPFPSALSAVFRLLAFLLLSFALTARPALAQSVLRDAETEALFKDMSRPLIIAAGLEPGNVQIILLGDKDINAFVAGGQAVYINSGLIDAADNANEVQGVIAHEIGHITGGHIVRFGEGMQAATGITELRERLAQIGQETADAGPVDTDPGHAVDDLQKFLGVVGVQVPEGFDRREIPGMATGDGTGFYF